MKNIIENFEDLLLKASAENISLNLAFQEYTNEDWLNLAEHYQETKPFKVGTRNTDWKIFKDTVNKGEKTTQENFLYGFIAKSEKSGRLFSLELENVRGKVFYTIGSHYIVADILNYSEKAFRFLWDLGFVTYTDILELDDQTLEELFVTKAEETLPHLVDENDNKIKGTGSIVEQLHENKSGALNFWNPIMRDDLTVYFNNDKEQLTMGYDLED